MDRGGDVVDEEELALRRCPIRFPGLGQQAPELGRLRERLERDRFVMVKAASELVGQKIVAEYAHAHSADYPGGTAWVRHIGATMKEPAADVVEALELPASCWQHWPFIHADGAFDTMWRGLNARGRALIVISDWPPWGSVVRWNPPDGAAHVIAIAGRASDVAPELSLSIESPDEADLEATTVTAFARRSESARKLLMVLACLGPQPVLPSLAGAIWSRIDPANSDPARAFDELDMHGLAARTTLGEMTADERILEAIRARPADWEALWKPVMEGLIERIEHLEWLHQARSVVANARFAAWAMSSTTALEAYDALLDAISSCPRAFEASEAAKARLVRMDGNESTAQDAARLETMLRLGHALSNRGELVEAQEVLREALSLAERAHGAHSLEVARVIDVLSRAIGLGSCGAPAPEVVGLHERALAIRERAWGPDDPRLEGDLWSLSLYYATDARWDEALDVIERAIALAETTSSSQLVMYVDTRASMLVQMGRLDEALTCVDRSLALRRGSSGRVCFVSCSFASVFEAMATSGRLEELLSRVDDVLTWPELRASSIDDDDVKEALARLHDYRTSILGSLGRP